MNAERDDHGSVESPVSGLPGGYQTPRVGDVLDLDNLARMVEERFIRATETDGMTLYNYTEQAQWTRTWNTETLTCRGLVVREDGTIQSRPFGKFFNLSEHAIEGMPPLPIEPFEVFEKVDGSLIVASTTAEGRRLVTTRGSFQSEQAFAAAAMWDERWPGLFVPHGQTWLFEFVAPWNRIVVDYGDRTDLVFLAAIDNATGADLHVPAEWPGSVVRSFDGLDDFDAIAARLDTLGPNDEGYVLRFASGVRAKAKGAEYMRLHKLLTGVSARTIWEIVANGGTLDDILERVPDEFADWVQTTASELLVAYAEIEALCRERHRQIADLPTRKDQALAIVDFEHKAVVFKMLDDHVHSDDIWKVLRPAAERPFRTEDAA